MKPIEGQISIDIYPYQLRSGDVEISSSRPLQATKILIGKTPAQALSIIPLMYNVCGVAQSRAALSAMQQCLGCDYDPKTEIARDMLLVEIAKEHLLRIFLDWPKLFDIDPGNHRLPYVNQLTTEFESALFMDKQAFMLDSRLEIQISQLPKLIENLQQYLEQHVFTIAPEEWLTARHYEPILFWSEQTTSIAALAVNHIVNNGWAVEGITNSEHLPVLDNGQLLAEFNSIDAEKFIAQPKWQGHCCETTALSRQSEHPLLQSFYQHYQNSLLTRWLARLVELARIPEQLTAMLNHINDDTSQYIHRADNLGLAQVETARGRLIHRAELNEGLISHYQILAPTEWNFHPKGLISQILANINHDDKTELQQIAQLMINAIDPCVGYKLRIH